ncbi:MAG: DUF3524 domain-containing protein [Dehalococcoidia bacterium]|nr:DUF3524 domain-containing protein [Chloroflexi bacterium CFX7]MCK6564894.1 DUF3524 domain-containing protein [Dehalococcoidia bacterium]NUQ55381.1 DUF3524 domain-containing protein [Dehalococcoidia bacterium]
MARVLFVEPFYGGSHGAFLDGLVQHSAHEIVPLTLPEGEWRRRMRRGAQELAPLARALPGSFDAIIATDMLDLPIFLALTRPRFNDIPVLLFMHENQFTYPRLRGTKLNSWFGQVNYLSAMAANCVAFNSEFHRQDFMGALRTLSTRPNNWLYEPGIGEVEAKGRVLPVGVELEWLDTQRYENRPGGFPLLLWNHRWEFDKSPEMFARAVRQLAAEGLRFRVAIAGEPGENPSPALHELRESLPELIAHFGFLPGRDEYARLLWQSGIVVSTTRHEFFGVGMVEALYCGCTPVLPNRYNYPALVPPALRERYLYDDEAGLMERLRGLITSPAPAPVALRESAGRFSWANVAPLWDAAIDELVRSHRPSV